MDIHHKMCPFRVDVFSHTVQPLLQVKYVQRKHLNMGIIQLSLTLCI